MRMITWNIQWGRGADGRVDLARTIATLRGMGEADVICLQEVARDVDGLAGGDTGDQVVALTEAFPGFEAVFAPGVDVPGRDGRRAQFGNLVLSRLPVDQACRHVLPFPPDPQLPGMRRACAEVVVLAPSGPLRVMCTHLEYYSAIQRRAQIEALRGLQDECAAAVTVGMAAGKADSSPVFAVRPRPVSVIVCGDFNCEPDSVDHELMARPYIHHRHGWCDAWHVAHPGVPHAPTVGVHEAEWPDRPYCCDYFWVSEDLLGSVRRVEVNAETDASDHQPVVLELEMPT